MPEIIDSLRALLESGKERGYLTYSQLNDYLPDDDAEPEKIDQLLVRLESEGIELIDESDLLARKIDAVLKTLTDQERKITQLRYGLGDDSPRSRNEVGRLLQILPDHVRKIEARAMRKLQHPARSRELEDFCNSFSDGIPSCPEERLLQRVFGIYPNMLAPSLFEYATSERCQDAFLFWLIAWASYNHRETNGPLHRTGVFFLNRLLALHHIVPPDKYLDLHISKYKHIDVLVKVNDDIAIVIEDKVDFSVHSDQLVRYLKTVRNDFKDLEPVPVYLKTGDHRADDSIEGAGWKCFLRRDMLEVLEYGSKEGVQSDIFRDFHDRLKHLERKSSNKRRQWRK
jgi:hypothetical protein